MDKNLPIILAISAASGFILGIRTLEYLLQHDYKIELIVSQNAYYIAESELGLILNNDRDLIRNNILEYLNLKNKSENLKIWLDTEFHANPSSGSYKIAGMIIVPSSMSTVAAIASGYTSSLIIRSADVCIKEKRKLLVVPRETPLSSIHLNNLLKLSDNGVIVVPPTIGFYSDPQSLDDCINFIVGKILDLFYIDNNLYKRWSL